MKLMLHNYDSQKRSVLFLPHKLNKNILINLSLQWRHLPGKIVTWRLVSCDVTSDQVTVAHKLQSLHLTVNK